eukprot:scaffold7.g3664.t1
MHAWGPTHVAGGEGAFASPSASCQPILLHRFLRPQANHCDLELLISQALMGPPSQAQLRNLTQAIDCLPKEYQYFTPVEVAEHVAFTLPKSNGSAAQNACVASGGYPSDSWWLIGNSSVQANSSALQLDSDLSIWAPIYAQQLRNVATLSSGTADYAFARQLSGPLATNLLTSLPKPFTFRIFQSGAIGSSTSPNDTLLAVGTLTYIDQSQCLPGVFGALSNASTPLNVAHPAPAPPHPTPAGAAGAPLPADSGGGGSSVSAAAIAVPVAVAAAAGAALGAWALMRRRRRARGEEALSLTAASSSNSADPEADPALLKRLALISSSKHCVIPYSEIQLQKKLGEGSYGSVWLGRWRETQVAVKLFLPRQGEGFVPPGAAAAVSPEPEAVPDEMVVELVQTLQKEAGIMAALRHPNCVLYLGLCVEPPALVMEFCGKGSLLEVINGGGAKLDWARRLSLAFGAAKGMLYLHSCSPPVLHRDLKSANLLVDRQYQVKVCDFNLSRQEMGQSSGGQMCAQGRPGVAALAAGEVRDQASSLGNSHSMGGAGNPRWLAPEVLGGAPATPASDVYAFGVVMWELLALRLPWQNEATWTIVLAGKRPPVPPPEACPGFCRYQAYVELMQRCWAQAPAGRPGFEEVCTRLREMVGLEAKAARPRKKDGSKGFIRTIKRSFGSGDKKDGSEGFLRSLKRSFGSTEQRPASGKARSPKHASGKHASPEPGSPD